MGRPTDNPKRHSVKARVDDETFRILNAYCKLNFSEKATMLKFKERNIKV